MIRLLLFTLAGLALGACTSTAQTVPNAPSRLDLSDFRLTFSEEFDDLDVSEWGCTSRWIAHTPWAGDFGSATFAEPRRGYPFTIDKGILAIEARKFGDEWYSGLLAAWDPCDSGFAQKYGYFEARIKVPRGAGFWPAFWLVGIDRSNGTAEIDILEHHTHKYYQYATALIQHPAQEGDRRILWSNATPIADYLLSDRFNTFGASIDENEVVFYLNRQEVWRTATPENFHQHMYPLVNLAMDAGFKDEDTPTSAKMFVDYIRIYQFKSKSF